jgi:hypothetical protein
MKGRLWRLVALALAFAPCAGGCAVPPYHMPAGFSSTYQRQIYGMEPVPEDPQYQGLTAVDSRGGIFYPITAFRDKPAVAENTQEKEPLDPMFLGSDPLSPAKTVTRTSDSTSQMPTP